MPDVAIPVSPALAGGYDLDGWQDPVTGRRAQVVRLGSMRGGALYFAGSAMITWAATANLRIWGIYNPVGSGKSLYVRRVYHWMWASAAATIIPVIMTRTSDSTNTGTAITATRPDNGSLVGAVALIRALPTAGTAVGGNIGASMVTPPTLNQIIEREVWNNLGYPARDIIVPPGTGLQIAAVGTPDADIRSLVECLYEEV